MTEQLSLAALKANQEYYENLACNHGVKSKRYYDAASRCSYMVINKMMDQYKKDNNLDEGEQNE